MMFYRLRDRVWRISASLIGNIHATGRVRLWENSNLRWSRVGLIQLGAFQFNHLLAVIMPRAIQRTHDNPGI